MKSPWGRAVVAVTAVSVAGMCAAIMSALDAGESELRAVIRLTAFTSTLFFLPAFTASALHRLVPSPATRWMVVNRRYLGLSFASSHLWHAIAIVAFVRMTESGGSIPPATLIFGGGGLVLIALMAATSNDTSVRVLGPRWWGLLHLVGVWVVWVDFIATSARPALASPFHAAMTVAYVGALGLRIAAFVARRRVAGAEDGRRTRPSGVAGPAVRP